jgi:hypothetical protein
MTGGVARMADGPAAGAPPFALAEPAAPPKRMIAQTIGTNCPITLAP